MDKPFHGQKEIKMEMNIKVGNVAVLELKDTSWGHLQKVW